MSAPQWASGPPSGVLQCSRCSWRYPAGSYHDCTDESIGSMLEYWLTRDTGRRCRFDNEPLPNDMERAALLNPAMRFCGPDCREAFRKVREARLVISERDLRRRGFD